MEDNYEKLSTIKKQFLSNFDRSIRGVVANYIYQKMLGLTIDQLHSSDEVFDQVTLKFTKEIKEGKKSNWYNYEKLTRLQNVFKYFVHYPDMMDNVVECYRLMFLEKYHNEQFKTHKDTSTKPATDKQLSYLIALGCKEVPDSKKRAMELIGEFKNGQSK
jgi:hypothetical protein